MHHRFCLLLNLVLLSLSTAVAETQLQITGLQQRSESQVLELTRGMLTHVRAGVATPYRADDAAFLVRKVLQKDGFASVQVEAQVINPRLIHLKVREGLRLSLNKVTLVGAAPDDEKKLSQIFSRAAEKDRPLAIINPPFREEDLATGLSSVRQQLNSEGYWEAQVTLASRSLDPANGNVDLVVSVKPGNLHRIGTAQFAGSGAAGFRQAATTLSPFVGRVATTGNLNAMRLAVEQSFVTQGYPDTQISMAQSLGQNQFTPLFTIELGKRVRLRKVHLEGLVRTVPSRLANHFRKSEGDWYDEAAMNQRLRGFLSTGAFSGVRLETTVVGEDTIDATLHFEEARAKEYTLAAGADSFQGFILRTGYTDRNLMGRLLGFNSGFEFSARGILGETRITDPWLYGSDVAGTARFYALIYGFEGYKSFETGFDGKITWKHGDHFTTDLLAGVSLVNLSENGLPSTELGETVYTHPRIVLTHSIDYRDSKVLPKSGWHIDVPLELGSAVATTPTSYARAGLTGGWFRRLNKHYDIGLGGESGVLVPTGDGQDLPIDLRLFNGGSRSVRSFTERDLGPSVDGYPTGGEAMWNVNAELIRNLTDSFKAVAFADAGSLSRNFEDLGAGDLEMAIGLGVRLDLPIGPVRVEYGYNLTQDPGEPTGTLHFAIGAAF